MFSFATPTPAALFRRADTVWLVFDHAKPIDIEPIRAKGGDVPLPVRAAPALGADNAAILAELGLDEDAS